jgi:hypothetical protein
MIINLTLKNLHLKLMLANSPLECIATIGDGAQNLEARMAKSFLGWRWSGNGDAVAGDGHAI